MTTEEQDDDRIRVLTQLNLAVEWIRATKDSIKAGPSIVICQRNVVIRFGYSRLRPCRRDSQTHGRAHVHCHNEQQGGPKLQSHRSRNGH